MNDKNDAPRAAPHADAIRPIIEPIPSANFSIRKARFFDKDIKKHQKTYSNALREMIHDQVMIPPTDTSQWSVVSDPDTFEIFTAAWDIPSEIALISAVYHMQMPTRTPIQRMLITTINPKTYKAKSRILNRKYHSHWFTISLGFLAIAGIRLIDNLMDLLDGTAETWQFFAIPFFATLGTYWAYVARKEIKKYQEKNNP